MNYRPLTNEQAQEMSRPQLIEDGEYQCELIEFSHTDKYLKPLLDRNSEPMTRIKLKIWDSQGKDRVIFTNLFWGANNKMSYRTRHFAESFEVLDMYEMGELYDKLGEVLNQTGHCEIYTQKPRPKNDGSDEMWPAKNEVRDFFVKIKDKVDSSAHDEFQPDSDIPF